MQIELIGRYDELDEMDTLERLQGTYHGEGSDGGERDLSRFATMYAPLGLSGDFVALGYTYPDDDVPVTLVLTPNMSGFDLMVAYMAARWPEGEEWESNWYWFVGADIDEVSNRITFHME